MHCSHDTPAASLSSHRNMKRRELILFGGLSAAGALSLGTGAVSTSSMARNASTSVTNEEDAYLYVERVFDGTLTPEDDPPKEVFEIRNQSPEKFDTLTFEPDQDGSISFDAEFTETGEDEVSNMGIGDSRTVSIAVHDRSKQDLDFNMTVFAEGSAVSIDKQYHYTLDVAEPEDEGGDDEGGDGEEDDED